MRLKYIVIVALGAMSYGPLQAFAKVAYGQGYTPAEIVFVQALLGSIVLWLLNLMSQLKKGSLKFTGGWKLLLAGTTMGVSAYLSYAAVKYIPVALGIVLLMQISWMSIFAEWLVFKKRPSKIEVLVTGLVIVGTIMAGNLLFLKDFSISITGILLGFGAAVFYTMYILMTSRLGNETPMFEKSAIMTTGSALMIFLVNFKTITSSAHFDAGLFKWGIFLAIFGTVIPPICFTKGMPKIGAGLSSILLTLELPAVALCAYLILGEPVSHLQIIGIMIMLGSIVYLNFSKTAKQKNNFEAIKGVCK